MFIRKETVRNGTRRHGNIKGFAFAVQRIAGNRQPTTQKGILIMFKITPNPTFKVAVNIDGSSEPLKLVFSRSSQTKRTSWLETLMSAIKAISDAEKADADTREDVDQTKGIIEAQADFLVNIINGWENCELEFSRSAVVSLLDNYDKAFDAILKAYREGGDMAAAKN